MDEEMIEFRKRMDEILKRGREFNDAVIISIRNGDFYKVLMLTEAINYKIRSQYKYIMTLIEKYYKNGDILNYKFLIQNLKHLENIERLNIMAREAAEEYTGE